MGQKDGFRNQKLGKIVNRQIKRRGPSPVPPPKRKGPRVPPPR